MPLPLGVFEVGQIVQVEFDGKYYRAKLNKIVKNDAQGCAYDITYTAEKGIYGEVVNADRIRHVRTEPRNNKRASPNTAGAPDDDMQTSTR